MLIGANVIMGVANATQLSFHVVMGELVPMKYRYVINAIMYSNFLLPNALEAQPNQSRSLLHPRKRPRLCYRLLDGSPLPVSVLARSILATRRH